MRFFILLTLASFLFFQSCTYGIKFVDNEYVPAEYVVMAHQLNAEIYNRLAKRHHMKLFGVGSGLADCVNVLGVRFQILGPLSKEEIRRIIVDCVEEYLTTINQNEQIRPFLKNYPFTSKEIDIAIFIVDKRGERMYHPEISTVSASRKVAYLTVDRKNILGYKTDVEEDYETALKIVKEEKNSPK